MADEPGYKKDFVYMQIGSGLPEKVPVSEIKVKLAAGYVQCLPPDPKAQPPQPNAPGVK
jgi:hypothetical protein